MTRAVFQRAWRAIARVGFALLGLLLLTGSAEAQFDNTAKAELFARVEGEAVRVAIRIEIEEEWHLYHDELGHPEAVGKPTKVTLSGEGITWSKVRFPELMQLDQSVFGEGVYILAHEEYAVLYAAGRLAEGGSTEGTEA